MPRKPQDVPVSSTMLERLERLKSKVLRRTALPGRPESQPATAQLVRARSEDLHRLFPTDESQTAPSGGQ